MESGIKESLTYTCSIPVDYIPRLWRYLACDEGFTKLPDEIKNKLSNHNLTKKLPC